MRLRIRCWLSLTLMLLLLLPDYVLAENPTAPAPPRVPATIQKTLPVTPSLPVSGSISLNQAILIVKKNFDIPANLTDFRSTYNNYEGERQAWYLEWRQKDDGNGSFSASVDAKSGEIFEMRRWNRQNEAASRIPTLSIEQARKVGQELLNRLIPEKTPSLILNQESNLIPLNGYGDSSYNITWNRVYKGIRADNDCASVEINMQTGEPVGYRLNWSSLPLPETDGVISAAQAAEVFNQEQMLRLQYFIPPKAEKASSGATTNGPILEMEAVDLPGLESSGAATYRPILVYAVHHPSGGAIDAKTGIPFKPQENNYGFLVGGMGENAKFSLDSGVAWTPTLTPEEQSEIDKSSGLISQDQAVQAVAKWIKLADNMTLQSANLERVSNDAETRYWTLMWRQKPDQAADSRYLWAQVDASTGELLSFRLKSGANSSKEASITRDEAQKIADEFVKRLQAKRWPELKLDVPANAITPLGNSTEWTFNYIRLVNGIPCYTNGIDISVDARSKEVVNYNLKWTAARFPEAAGVLGADQASSIYLKASPLTLKYSFVPTNSGKNEARLLYIPEVKNGLSMLDARKGTLLNWEGNTLTLEPRALTFKDIKGHYAEKEISLLGQAGLMGEYGDAFHPEEKIKLRSLLTVMLYAREGISSPGHSLSDKDLIKRCQQLGWINGSPPLDARVNRELLGQLMLRYINIDFLTEVGGIYCTPYQDAKTMSPKTQAIAALTWGLGIIKADGKNFASNHLVTRAEAAASLVHTLSVKTRPQY